MTGRGTVLVTGASGGIGAQVVAAARADGWHVRALVHRSPVHGVDERVDADLLDAQSLTRALSGADAVLHLAAVTHARRQDAYDRVNVEGTRSLIEAARSASVGRFVFVSTRAISEQGGAYSISKARAEALVADSGLPFAIVRLAEVYGASDEGIDRMIAQARRGRPVPVVGRGTDVLCPVHVDDVARPLVAALSSAEAVGQTYTLGGEPVTTRAFALLCIDLLDSRSRVVSVPTAAVAALAAAARALPLPMVPDQLARLRSPKPGPTPEAREHLGFAPRPLREGLRGLDDSQPVRYQST